MYVNDIRVLLADADRRRGLLKLQGQRGDALEQALATGLATRLGPAQCAVFGALALVVADPGVYLLLALASMVGVVTSHHPVEWLYVAWADRQGRTPLPPNRAPRRFACLVGAAFFLTAAIALMLDLPLLFWLSASSLVVIPGFVAATNLCLPSLLFTVLLGAGPGTCPTLPLALRHRHSVREHDHRGFSELSSQTVPEGPVHS